MDNNYTIEDILFGLRKDLLLLQSKINKLNDYIEPIRDDIAITYSLNEHYMDISLYFYYDQNLIKNWLLNLVNANKYADRSVLKINEDGILSLFKAKKDKLFPAKLREDKLDETQKLYYEILSRINQKFISNSSIFMLNNSVHINKYIKNTYDYQTVDYGINYNPRTDELSIYSDMFTITPEIVEALLKVPDYGKYLLPDAQRQLDEYQKTTYKPVFVEDFKPKRGQETKFDIYESEKAIVLNRRLGK